MDKMCLMIDQANCLLERSAPGVLCLRDQQGNPYKVGVESIESVIVQRQALLDSRALQECFEAGVDVVLAASGRFRSEPVTLHASRRRLRMSLAQMAACGDEVLRLAIARALVVRKLQSQAEVLSLHGVGIDFAESIERANEAPDIASLMGIEGSAARRYFEQWRGIWAPPFVFNGRNRRPPKDPVNGLMSLSYTLALQKVGRTAQQHYFDLQLSFLHHPLNHRQALCLDLLEPARPWIDHWIWQQLSMKHLLSLQHFENTDQNGCRLNKEGRSRYYMAWQASYRALLLPSTRRTLALLKQRLKPAWHQVQRQLGKVQNDVCG